LTNYKGRTVIAFAVDVTSQLVSILGVFYGGQDYAALLAESAD
jgi:toxin ParE1/3/4